MNVHLCVLQRPVLARLLIILALASGGLLLAQPHSAAAATFSVTKTSDSKDGACNHDCSLREAIIAAHQQPGVDTITLSGGTYRVTLSDLDITSSLNLVGVSAATTIIESNGQDRVLEVRPNITVTIDKVTIRNGNLVSRGGNGGGILNDGTLTLTNSTVTGNVVEYPYYGAGIYNTGTLTLTNSTVSSNSSEESSGGGIYNHMGTVTISNSSLSNNRASPGSGGGVFNQAGMLSIAGSTVGDNASYSGAGILNSSGTVTIATSSISNNRAYFDGGGISNAGGSVTLTSSTVSGNSAQDSVADGGGIYNGSGGTLTIANSTISGNELGYAGAGGGIFNSATMTIANSTVTGNSAVSGSSGGISSTNTASTIINNTIVAGNSADTSGPDCGGTLNSQGYNLIQNTSGCTISGSTTGNVTGVGAQLGPLQHNGSATLTHLPASTSPAVDAGNPATPGSGSTACLATDQRGQMRPKDGNGDSVARCDIGAVER